MKICVLVLAGTQLIFFMITGMGYGLDLCWKQRRWHGAVVVTAEQNVWEGFITCSACCKHLLPPEPRALNEWVWLHKHAWVRKARVWVDSASISLWCLSPHLPLPHSEFLHHTLGWAALHLGWKERIWLGSWGRSGAALCLHTLSCPRELVCMPMPLGGKRTVAFPWKTARCHKGKLGGSGELTSSADCWEDRPQTVRKFKEYLFSPVWKSGAGCFPVQHLWVETSQAASVSSSFWCEIVSFKKKVPERISAASLYSESSSFLATTPWTCQCPEV